MKTIRHIEGISPEIRRFNVTGSCNPKLHYMVDLTERLEKIKALVDNGDYFTINRARQYGKTTTIKALTKYLQKDYIVIPLDFQRIGHEEFQNAHIFAAAFSEYLSESIEENKDAEQNLDMSVLEHLQKASGSEQLSLRKLFVILSKMCRTAKKPVVIIIDEADSATNNQVFLDFLAQFRSYYLNRETSPTFQSVILASVYDVKNIKIKMRPESEHRVNSPWNIATDFLVDMSFNTNDIKGMLAQYEADHRTGMNLGMIAEEIYDYTSGYPFLVSKICKLLDERIAGTEQFPDKKAAWTKEGIHTAVNLLTSENNTLFESLTGKLLDYPELKQILSEILFEGKDYPYIATNYVIEMAVMFGFVQNEHNVVKISNRIFETILYNHLLSEEIVDNRMYNSALANKYLFTDGQHLNMKRILEGFVKAFTETAQDKGKKFLEEEGRKYFMLYLKPIINGTGHSYVEARTRNLKRTDLIVDYLGEQYVIEMKIWNGPKYHAEGEQQILEYLDYYGLKKGYMLIFNFNKNKEIGVREVQYGDRVLVEAMV